MFRMFFEQIPKWFGFTNDKPQRPRDILEDTPLWQLFTIFIARIMDYIALLGSFSPISFGQFIQFCFFMILSKVIYKWITKKGRPTKSEVPLPTLPGSFPIKPDDVYSSYSYSSSYPSAPQPAKTSPDKFRPGKNFSTWIIIFEDYVQDVNKIKWRSYLLPLIDERCLNDNAIDPNIEYSELRAKLLGILYYFSGD